MATAISIQDKNIAVLFQSPCSYLFRYGKNVGDIYRKGGKQDREKKNIKIYILQKKGSICNPAFVLCYVGHQLVLNTTISDAPASIHNLRSDAVLFNALDVSTFQEGFFRNFCVSFKDAEDGDIVARNFLDVHNFLCQFKALAKKTSLIKTMINEKDVKETEENSEFEEENEEENEEKNEEENEEEHEEENEEVDYDVDVDGPSSQSWPTYELL